MSAGDAASTVTPGRTAPVESLATPAIAPVVVDCASAYPCRNKSDSTATHRVRARSMSASRLEKHAHSTEMRTQPFASPLMDDDLDSYYRSTKTATSSSGRRTRTTCFLRAHPSTPA